jgi:hypothetical protein
MSFSNYAGRRPLTKISPSHCAHCGQHPSAPSGGADSGLAAGSPPKTRGGLRPKEAARYLGLGLTTTYALVARGELRARKPGPPP